MRTSRILCCRSVEPRPNFSLQLTRPGFGRQPSCLPRRQRDGVTPVAVRASLSSGHALQPVRRSGFGARNRPLN
jgi:hypothetical protein